MIDGESLTELTLVVTNITLTNIADLTTTLLKLEILSLRVCRNINDAGRISLLNRVWGELRYLEFAHSNITLDNIGDLTISFQKLEGLNISHYLKVTDASTISLLNRVRGELKNLNLSGTCITLGNIADTRAISLLNKIGGELKHLDISSAYITPDNIGDLTTRFNSSWKN